MTMNVNAAAVGVPVEVEGASEPVITQVEPGQVPVTAAGDGLRLGIDVGSTTVKLAALDNRDQVVWATYQRHHADVRATIVEVLKAAAAELPDQPMTVAITGSGGLLLSQWLDITFVQEVIASKTAVEAFIPRTDVAIELGGEDAKIIYFDHGIEQRMNGTSWRRATAPSTPSPAAAACSPRPTCSRC